MSYGSYGARSARGGAKHTSTSAATEPVSEGDSQIVTSFLGTQPMTREQLRAQTQAILELMKTTTIDPNNQPMSVNEVVRRLVDKAGPIYKQCKMTDAQMEGMYNVGYQAFQQGNYRHAIGAFRMLFMLNPLEKKYIFSLGLSLERSKKFFEGATAYMMHAALDEANPVPIFRAAICFLEFGEPGAARIYFLKTLKLCGEDPMYVMVSNRAKLFLNGLDNPATAASEKGAAGKATEKVSGRSPR